MTIKDGSQTYTGSAVQQISVKAPIKCLGSLSSTHVDMEAEAVPVKIGNKGYVFMIFSSAYNTTYSKESPVYYNFISQYYTGAIRNNADQTGNKSWDVLPEFIPAMVTFSDLNDMKTVKPLNPNNLAEIFGGGVSLVSVHVENTREPVTKGQLDKILPWIAGKDRGMNFNGNSGSQQFEGSTILDSIQIDNFVN